MSNGPPPPPPPPGSKPDSIPGSLNSLASDDDGRLRARNRLHWDVLRNVGDESVWQELHPSTSSSDILKLDVKKFEELFCIVPGEDESKKKSVKMVQKVQYNTILDMRRANNVAIGLARFSRRGMSGEDIIKAINGLDEEALNVEDLVTYQTLLPTLDERNLIKKSLSLGKHDPELPFAPAESFMMQVMDQPDLPLQVLAFLYKLQLPTEYKELRVKLDHIIDLCKELRLSEAFKKLLRIVLELGNMTNYEYGAGNASYRPWMGKQARALGFKIEGLARLRDVKSSDGKWSLMTFLVDMIHKNYPAVSFFGATRLELKTHENVPRRS
jgi:hypothetical protein